MAKINDYVRKFSGRLSESTIKDLHKKLDYTLDTLEDRLALVEEICSHSFFQEYFNTKDKQTVDYNFFISGYDDKLEELKAQKDELVKQANQCIVQYKKTRDMSLLETNDYLKEMALQVEATIEQMKIEKTKAYEDIPERVYFNVHPKCYSEVYSGDPLGADNNVCQTLEKMADYILKMDIEYVEPSVRQKKKITYIETSLDEIMEYSGDFEDGYDYNHEKYKGNYKLEIRQKIYKDDFGITKVDKKRTDKIFIKHRRNTLNQMQEAVEDLMRLREHSTGKKYFLDKAIGELSQDMILAKDSYNGTIYFKRVMPDSCDMDENQIDFRDINHIKALLECSPSSQKWYGTTSMALEGYLHDLKHKISREDWDDLQFVRECYNLSYNKLLEETGYSREKINASVTRIAKLVYKHHMEISQDLWYLNMVRGTYKQCSRCGEIKLVQKYSADANRLDGLDVYCKTCRKS